MISKDGLLRFLEELDRRVKSKITMVAVGGTAMVLMGLKESTKDIDFCAGSQKDYDFMKRLKIRNDFKVDLFYNGYIFCLQLPSDYIRRARALKTGLKMLNIKILSPIDIVITKSSRLNQRDIEDIRAVISKKKISREKLVLRFNEVKKSWPSSDKTLEENFRFLLREFF